MAQFNSTTFAAYLKSRFDKTAVSNGVTKRTSRMLKDLKRDTTGGGDVRIAMQDVTDAVSFSADFPTAQTGADNINNQGLKFTIDWFEVHGVAHLSSKVINQTKNNALAWGKAVDVAMNKSFAGMAHGMSILVVGQGWGEIGQITGVSGATFAPLVPSQIHRYAIGLQLHFSSALNTAGLRSSTTLRVIDVDATPGSEKVTCSANLATVSAVNSDWAFIAGCRQDSATPARLVPAGMDAWLPKRPVADATISTLYGATRTARAYGQYVDGTGGGSPLNFLLDAGQAAGSIGNAESITAYCSPNTWGTISKDLQTNVRYVDEARQKTAGTNELMIVADGLQYTVK